MQFLKCPDNALHSDVVYVHVYWYILPELRPFLRDLESYGSMKLVEEDGEEMIQTMLDKSNNQLSKCWFPSLASPVIYNSLNGEKYICKPDIYTVVQNIALHTIKRDKTDSFRVLLAHVLKSKSMRTDGQVEFVKFDEKMFDEIEKEMREGETKSLQQAWAQRHHLEMLLLAKNYAAIASKFRELNPTFWDLILSTYLEPLQLLSRTHLAEAKELVFIMLSNTCVINGIEQVMAKRASLLMSTPESSSITVRLFEDGKEKYVMEMELYHALNRVSPESERFDIQNDGFVYKGMSFECVKAEFGDRIQKIEFIRTPILRSKHCAVPIRSHFPGEFVIPAVDYFFEFWKNVILGVKLFQKHQCSDWGKFVPLFRKLVELFDSEKKQQYFLRADIRVESVASKSLEPYGVSPVKDVRNAKKDGFTAQNLKNELAHLGLTNTFPEIQDYAEDVYEKIDKAKKERYLRTCDLFDALENCQLICVLNRAPSLKKFLHHQKGCERVLGYRCEQCKKEKTMSDALEVSQQPAEVQKTSDIQNSMKNLKIESSGASMLNQYSQPALFAPKDYEKCFQSSKVLTETQNELKMSQDQLKDMQQEITNAEKELSDLKKESEKIVESKAKKTEELAKMEGELNNEKEKNQEKEEEILKASKENEELQKTILKLTAENEANENVIQKLLDRITDLSISNQKTNHIDEKTTEESTPTASVTSKNAPLVIDCLICSSQIKSGQKVIRCPLCKRRFHSNCAFKWRKDHTQCPACNGDLPGI
ncbi:hypothetical protein GCK72_002875 [Caenorhabditis remanei]|uniref:RING-type domain-containing protein n=1 Tax=Caenorhabditis remanei TaxID=31234 RepID=A0A6A5HS84_CAERE|nr:hypothetical protein GCK72_002875 [Caenorhabditis remanei]KAF1771050.1 hypothetical protein GCK72_002875 [Caenorhabditis remanei]